MSCVRWIVGIALVSVVASGATATAAPGDLDPTFGKYGKFLLPVAENTTADDVLVTADGRTVVGGSSSAGATIFGFTAAGRPDPSFGQSGRVTLPSTYGDASVALQGDRVVAAASDRTGRLVVFRLQPNGALDPSFGAEGVAATNLSSGGPAPQVAIAPDQKIVVASTSAPISGLVVARLLPAGDGFDPSFAGGVVYAAPPRGFAAQGVAVGPDNRITVLASGFAETSRMFRYADDGTPDPSFGTSGEAAILPGGGAYLIDLALRPDGSSVAVGDLDNSSKGVVAALTPAGQLDPAFAGDGAVETPNRLAAVGIDSQGRILAAGSGTNAMELTRYLPDGTADASFGRRGVASGRFGRQFTAGRALAFMPDGRIVVAAERVTGFRSTHYVLGLMRFLIADGPRDPDADGVLGKRDRCPSVGGPARYRGCPLIKREVELEVADRTLKGAVSAGDRACRGEGKAVIIEARKGRDQILDRRSISDRGRFKARLEPRFVGWVYARITQTTRPEVGRCGPATSNKVSVG